MEYKCHNDVPVTIYFKLFDASSWSTVCSTKFHINPNKKVLKFKIKNVSKNL